MAKRTAVVDVGSNSIKLVIFERTSRFGFIKIKEVKANVKLSKGSFKDKLLQEDVINNAFLALKEFAQIIKNYTCNKTLCIGTSALRDAKNSSQFINKVRKELNLKIKIINGEKEAFFGAVSCINLVSKIDEFLVIDIGGGSTEISLIKNGKITALVSLDIGAIRIKEVFKDDFKKAKSFIKQSLENLPEKFHQTNTLVSIGGASRTIAKLTMPPSYPIKEIHNFEYKVKKHIDFINSLMDMDKDELIKLGVSKDRAQILKEGVLIFTTILEHFHIKKVVASKTGIREGVFLADLLRNQNYKFPENFNVNVKTLLDRFNIKKKNQSRIVSIAKQLFDVLKPIHNCDEKYKQQVVYAVKLIDIGKYINFENYPKHSFSLLLNELTFGFTHKEKLLIASLVRFQTNKLFIKKILDQYEELLPNEQVIIWLSFIVSLSKALLVNLSINDFEFKLENGTLIITTNAFLAKEYVAKLEKPIEIEFRNKE